jgi:Na+/H+ antiporter NhaD/arsenite permease-like protein
MAKHIDLVRKEVETMIEFSHGPALWQTIAAVMIALIAYFLILTDSWNRNYVAIAGAALMVVLGIVPMGEALTAYMSWNAIFLLMGVYISTALFQKNGLIQYAAMWLIQQTKAKPLSMLLALTSLAAIGSAALDGIVMVLALIPFTISATRLLKISPVPFLIGEIMACNIGGAATLVGSIPNRLIGATVPLSFNQFWINLGPLQLVLLLVLLLALRLIYGNQFVVAEALKKELLALKPESYLRNKMFVAQEGVVAIIILIAYLLQGWMGMYVGLISIIGACLFLVIDYKTILHMVQRKDYRLLQQNLLDSQIIFFIGLLVMVGGLVHSGVPGYFAGKALEITQGGTTFMGLLILWVSSLSSSALDQVPYVAAMIPVIQESGFVLGWTQTGQLQPFWWSLAIGAGIGGGATLMGSLLNLVAVGIAMKEKIRMGYWEYFRVAFPLSLLMLIISSLYLILFIY